MLSSGLADIIHDQETLARILTSSSHHGAQFVKPAAFLPHQEDMETSVFRHPGEPRHELWSIAEKVVLNGRTLHGAASLKAIVVRTAGLLLQADEPPDRHAVIRGWPRDPDPDLQKARQKEIALVLAEKSEFLKP